MKKSLLVPVGFFGLGLVLYGFTRKNALDKAYFETNTDDMLNVLDKNMLFSDSQIRTLAKQIKEQNAGNYQKHIQVSTWKGLMSLDLEGQLSDKGTLDFSKMKSIASGLDKAIDLLFTTKSRAISTYCKQNGFSVSDRVYTIENNLIKLASAL